MCNITTSVTLFYYSHCNIATYLRGVIILHCTSCKLFVIFFSFVFLLLNLLCTFLYSCGCYTLFLVAPTGAALQIPLYAELYNDNKGIQFQFNSTEEFFFSSVTSHEDYRLLLPFYSAALEL